MSIPNAEAATWNVAAKMQMDQASMFKSSVTVIAPTGQSASLWSSTSALSPHLHVGTNGLIGMGGVASGARLDVKATGSASTDYAQIWRNSANTIVSSISATGVLTPSQPACQYVGYPAHAIMLTTSGCPPGWSEYTGARGRYLVGSPAGTPGGTTGTALTNLENRDVGRHRHSINDPGHTHSITTDQGGGDCCHYGGSGVFDTLNGGTMSSSGLNISGTQNTGSAGTNVPYIQVRICEKD